MKKAAKICLVICGIFVTIGIVMCIAGLVLGVNINDGLNIFRSHGKYSVSTGNIDKEFDIDNIEKLVIDSNHSDIDIVRYDGKKIKVQGKMSDNGNVELSSHTLSYKDSSWFSSWLSNGFGTSEITISIPESMKFEKIDINVDAGELTADSLYADEVKIDTGAGHVECQRITAVSKIDAKVGAGELTLENANSGEVKLDCGVGQLKYEGIINGKVDAECGVGQLVFDLDQNEKYYNYDMECGIGSIKLNSNNYSSIDNDEYINNNAKYEFDANCGVGSITIETN